MFAALLLAATLVPPKPLAAVQAEYPQGELSSGREAEVALELTLTAEGHVADARVTQSAGAAFDASAVDAAKRLEFAPATLDGKPVPVKIGFRVRFMLAVPHTVKNVEDLAVLRGRVLERGSRDPLAGATVSAGGAVEVTDATGAFELRARAGKQHVKVAASGHEPEALDVELPAELTVRLRKDELDPYSATVTGQRSVATVRTLDREEAARVPGTQGDVLRAVADLPGVARPPLGLGVLVVRGGAPEDTKVFLEGDEIPLAFHLGALTAVVNTDGLSGLDFIPGAYPARFGRATAGIIDLRTRAGGERLHGYAQLDFVGASAFVEGPIGASDCAQRDSCAGTFLASARRSWVDLVLGAVLPLTGTDLTLTPRFWDYQLRVDLKQRVGELHFGVFGSQDRLDSVLPPQNGDPRSSLGVTSAFHRVYGGWTRPLGHGLVNAAQLAFGVDLASVQLTKIVHADSTIWRGTLRDELRWQASDWLALAVGVDAQAGNFKYVFSTPDPYTNGQGGAAPSGTSALLTQSVSNTIIEPGVYAQATLTAGGLTLVPGLRWDRSDLVHAAWLDPRLNASFTLWRGEKDEVALKAGGGLFHEHPAPNYLVAIYGNPGLDPERSAQTSAGVIWQRVGFQLDVTLYDSELSHLPAFTRDLAPGPDGTPAPLNFSSTGSGWSRGVEVLLRLEPRPGTFGWLAYTYARSFRDDGQGQGLHPYDFDQPNVLTAVFSTKLGRGYSVGARVRYATGNPTTPIERGVLDSGNAFDFPVYGQVNSDRLPDFFELDLRGDKEWTFDGWKLSTYVEILNATNHANAEQWKYNYDFSERAPYIGIPFFPSLGVRGEL